MVGIIGGLFGILTGLGEAGFLFAFLFTGLLILFYLSLFETLRPKETGEGLAFPLGAGVAGGLYTLIFVIYAFWL